MLGKKATQDDWYKALLGFDEVYVCILLFSRWKNYIFFICGDFKSVQVQILYMKVRYCLNGKQIVKIKKKHITRPSKLCVTLLVGTESV